MKNQSEKILVAAHGALTHGADTEREERVLRIGNLTGLSEKNGKFRKANFERGLPLDGLVEVLQPREVLELGPGRGLGAFVMAASAEKIINDINTTALDVLTTDTKQHWPIESYGHREILCASRREVWSEQFPDDVRRMFSVIEVLPTEGLVFW